MDAHISPSARERLPKAIKALDNVSQSVYIHLRLRKGEQEISKDLALSLDDARQKMDNVRWELARAGQLYLIEDPQFISLHSEDPGGGPDLPIASGELDQEAALIMKEFAKHLRAEVQNLPAHQSRLLMLRYKHRMTARDIAEFSEKLGVSLIEGKQPQGLSAQDVFYGLNIALKAVLKGLRARYGDQVPLALEGLKLVLEEVEL